MQLLTFYRCHKPCAWLAFLLCSLTITANAAYADTKLTLNDALARTLSNNPQLYQYRFTQEALSARRQTSALRPAMAFELEVENFAGSGSTAGFDSAETTLAISSVIELAGKRQARVSYTDARINQAEWEQQATTLDVLGELTTAYIEGLATQANIRLAEESLALSQSLLKTLKTRSKQGAAPEAEVMRGQAAVARAEIRLASLEEQFQRQKVQLARFRDAAGTLARAGGRSDLTWRAGIKRFEETGDSAFTVGLSIPLFSNKRNSGEVKAALANRNAVDYARQDLLLRLHAQLFEAWSLRKQSLAAANKTQNVVIPALENALKLTREAYENGRYRYLDLIAAQEELLATKQARIDAASTALICQALIEKLSSEALNR